RIDRDHDDAEDHHEEGHEQHHQRGQRDAVVDVEHGGGDEQQHQRDQLAHLEPDVGHDLVVDGATEFDRVHQGAEVVVGEDHPGGLLGDLAAAAHRDPDV